MTWIRRLVRLASMPPHRSAALVAMRGAEFASHVLARQQDKHRSSFGPEKERLRLSLLRFPTCSWNPADTHDLQELLAGRVDLLGSGRVDITTLAPNWNEVHAANRKHSASIAKLVSTEHQSIDWQRDAVSGHRWSNHTWYRDIRYGHQPGVEVKWPWELARLQHLPRLALAAGYHPDAQLASVCARVIRDQTLDFIASNPPRWGVNWSCAMDVGIRIANLLLAHDLLVGSGRELDDSLRAVLTSSTRDHALFLLDNLEWSSTSCSNHYLADICGLLWAAAHLEPSTETDAWLAFAIQEIIHQSRLQFLPDGANFEGSTSYHRLSGEMLVYACALIAGLPADRIARLQSYDSRVVRRPVALQLPPLSTFANADGSRGLLPPWMGDLLSSIGDFSAAIRTPDGGSVQIGDNDSGRFFKISPAWALVDSAIIENHLDHSHLLHAIDGLLPRSYSTHSTKELLGRDYLLTSALADGHTLNINITQPAPPVTKGDIPAQLASLNQNNLRFPQSYRFAPRSGMAITNGLGLSAFPDFGLWIWRSSCMFLAVRCGILGQQGNGGHAHYDQLGIELWFDKDPVIRDPGTGCYTPNIAIRNAFRSPAAHWAPYGVGCGAVPTGTPTFALPGASPGQVLAIESHSFLGTTIGAHGEHVCRYLQITPEAVLIEDLGDQPLKRLENHSPHDSFSRGYGIIEPMDRP